MHRLLLVTCLILLSASVIGTAASLPPGPGLQAAAEKRWEKDITTLETLDASETHPADSILFVGSSSIRKWDGIAYDMAPYHPVKRGFGGSKFSDVAVFAERLISPHQFQALVLFVGNDVKGKPEDATPEQVAGWFGYVVDVAQAAQPGAAVFCIEVTPTESRWEAWPKIREVNHALATECANRPNVFFIPTAHAYLGPDGQVLSDLFGEDQLHQNELGYRIWSAVIKSHLDAVLDPRLSVTMGHADHHDHSTH